MGLWWERNGCFVVMIDVIVLWLLVLLVERSFPIHQILVKPLADVVTHLGWELVGQLLLLLLQMAWVVPVGAVQRLLLIHLLMLKLLLLLMLMLLLL